ncbi:MAG: DNA replication/repair protein RecF [Crocinitomicaceae bacterium]|nr:DNA replication/repair protein RecF [Crocinitomicaceae bacterium]
MQIKELSLHQFKNHHHSEISFSSGVNAFIGPNGSGKTNVLDAIHYLSMCKSYLNSIDKQNIEFNEKFFSISGIWEYDKKKYTVNCSYKLGSKKTVKLNKKEYDKLADHIGRFPVVFISPYDGDLINEGSELRRKWIDGIISQVNPRYLSHLQSYQKVLNQRNALLKNMHEHRLFDLESIEVWDVQMVKLGNEIHRIRAEFVTSFIPIFKKFYDEIGIEEENVKIAYRSQLNESDFSELLKENHKKDSFTQYSNVGTHKDDLLFTIKDHPIKKFGSQGQQKSFIIALRLAQFEWLKTMKETSPILLLDDIFDKLDHERVQKLVSLVTTKFFGQVIISDTDKDRMVNLLNSLSIQSKLFETENGTVKEISI